MVLLQLQITAGIIALIHNTPETLSVEKSELNPEARKKLDEFRGKVSKSRLVKFWDDAKELPGMVALSLTKTIKLFPATGWSRATSNTNESLLLEINELRKQTDEYKKQISKKQACQTVELENLADLKENFTILGGSLLRNRRQDWSNNISWLELFKLISPTISNKPKQFEIYATFTRRIVSFFNIPGVNHNLDENVFESIIIQFELLGLISQYEEETKVGISGTHFKLTEKGRLLMYKERAITSSM